MSSIAMRIAQLELLIPYGLEQLLSLIDVEESESIPSAAIPLGGRPKIYINPQFVEKHCQEDDALAALILHELHHLLLGHTRLFKRITPLHNIAFDAVINAMIARQEPRYATLFTQIYDPHTFPQCLLRPPEGFPYTPQFPTNMHDEFKHLILELYTSTQTTFLEVFECITKNTHILSLHPMLLGSHGKDVRGITQHDDPDLFAAVRHIVERWPQPKDPKIGRSLRNVIDTKFLHIEKQERPEDIFIRAIKNCADQGYIQLKNHLQRDTQSLHQCWPNMRDRRAFAFSQSGVASLLYQKELPSQPAIHPVVFYFDVSGSMDSIISAAASAIIRCSQWIQKEIYIFSTKLFPITLEDLAKGSYRSTGGTSFDVVAQHIHENHIRSAVILSDGYVGPTPKNFIPACKKANLQLILTPNGYSEDLKSIVKNIHFLGALS